MTDSGLPTLRASVESALLAGAATSAGATAVMATLAPRPVFVASLALAWLSGALLGSGFGAVRVLLARLPGPFPRLAWLGLGGALGLSAAWKLGAFHKLGGEHNRLALGALLAGTLGGAALGAILASLQPTRYGIAPVLRLRASTRRALGAVLAVLGLGTAAYEAAAGFLGSYPVAQRALTGASVVCAGASVLSLIGSLRPRPALLVGWLALAALAALRLGLETQPQLARLARTPHAEHLTALWRAASDWDADGFSGHLAGGDCAPFDANVHPRAREVPGNGVDDNCRSGDAPPPPPLPGTAAQRPHAPPPLNLVLVTVDALRADHTSPYGYSRDTTPNLAKLAAAGLRFENAYTSGGWTCLALPSLMTGVYPRRLEFKPWAHPDGHTFTLPAAEHAWTIQGALRERGYRTSFFASHYLDTHLVRFMTRGWDDFVFARGGNDADVTNAATERLRELGSQPFFLWVHYYDAHDKQTLHPGVPRFGDTLVDGYDHEVASVDHELGRLLQALESIPGRATAILVTADHGEALVEPYQFHGNDLFEDGIRVPLIVRAPGIRPNVIATPASLVDIAPTLLALSGAPPVAGLDGQDLRTLSGYRAVITDLWRLDRNNQVYLDQIAVSTATHRLIYDRLLASNLLVRARDLRRPPEELPISAAPPGLHARIARYEDQSLSP